MMKNLIFFCCDAIAKNDMMIQLKEIAQILPEHIIKYLLRVFDEVQFAQFHSFYPIGSQHESLFLEKYRHDNVAVPTMQDHQDAYVLHPAKKLELCYSAFWKNWIWRELHNSDSVKSVRNLAIKAPHVVTKLEVDDDSITTSTLKCYDQFVYIEAVYVHINSVNRFQNLLQIAQRYRKLKKLNLALKHEHAISSIQPSLSNFLEFKASINDHVVLCFQPSHSYSIKIDRWFSGTALEAISGIQFRHASFDNEGNKWAKIHSKIQNIKYLKLYSVNNVRDCLLDLIQDAPTTKTSGAMSKLKLDRVEIDIDSLHALEHWRYRKLQAFMLSHVYLGDEGVMQLAKHAEFWPMVKKVVLKDCRIRTRPFIHLLQAMAYGDGCKNLLALDISENSLKKSALKAIGNFLIASNVRNLKILRMQELFSKNVQVPNQFLYGIHSTTLLIRLQMHNNHWSSNDAHQIMHALFSNPNSPMENISIFKWHNFEGIALKNLKDYFTSKSAKSNIADLQPDEIKSLYDNRYGWLL